MKAVKTKSAFSRDERFLKTTVPSIVGRGPLLLKKFGVCLLLSAVAFASSSCGPRPNIVPEVESVQFGATRVLSDHIEVDIRLPTSDTTLGGTLFLPLGQGVFPTIVLQPGSQPWKRTTTANYPGSGAAYYNSIGVAAWSYDKRGVGRSGGTCCQGDIEQLATDALASVDAVSLHPQVDATRIGIDGVSQGGWVSVNAAARSTAVAFIVNTVGPAVSTFEEEEFSRLTGDSVCADSGLSSDQIDELMETLRPAGYDPRADLAVMKQPGMWTYGGLDTSIPVRQSIAVLERLKSTGQKDWEIVLKPDANHFMIRNGGPCQEEGERVSNLQEFEEWFSRTVTRDTP